MQPSQRRADAPTYSSPQRLQRAVELHCAGKLYAARALYEATQRGDPHNPDVLHLLGLLRLQCDDSPGAIKLLRQAIALQPKTACYYGTLAKAYHELGLYREAIAAAQVALELNPTSLVARLSLGLALFACGQRTESIRHLRRALKRHPENLCALTAIASLAERENRLGLATRIVRRHLPRNPANLSLALTAARLQRRAGRLRQALRHLLDACSANPRHDDSPHLHFELGQIHDQLEEPDQAFRCFVRAQTLKRRQQFRRVEAQRLRDQRATLQRTFTADWVRSWRCLPLPNPSPPPPTFVFGFPRSGNTLLDQILNRHSRLKTLLEKPMADAAQKVIEHLRDGYPHALAELTEVDAARARRAYFDVAQRRWRRRQDCRLVDTFPLNTTRIGLLHRLFPHAKLVLVLRHPCDVCLSCFMQNFADAEVSERFATLADAATEYAQVMDLWQQYSQTLRLDFHVVRYERLIEDLSGETRALCQYLEIPWEPAMCRLDEAAPRPGHVDTASYDQVTQGLYQRSRYRWLRYAKHLAPILPHLQPYAERYGYSLDAHPAAETNPIPGAFEARPETSRTGGERRAG